jgi:3-methylfumaryl-CoA hydratase
MSGAIERTELLQPEPAHALGSLLGVPVPDLAGGEALPLLWHWVYLLDRPAQADLGLDGHPVRGSLPAPPRAGTARMWAAGRVRTHGSLRCGMPATKRTSVRSVTEKQGRSGHLTFVTVGHQIRQDGKIVVDEEQSIVYRQSAAMAKWPPGAPAAKAVPADQDEWAIDVSPTLLFRFSALTYNSHRIHYDRDYAREVEGYPGLLTHGPLQALAMAEAARTRVSGTAGSRNHDFAYRLESPLFDHQGMIVRAVREDAVTVTCVRDAAGRRTASGTLRYSSESC